MDGVVCGAGGSSEECLKEEEKLCRDYHDECSVWAAMGECLRNSLYMQDKCKYSCGKCVRARSDRRAGVDEDVITRKFLYAEMDTGRAQLIRGIPGGDDGGAGHEDPMSKEESIAVFETIKRMERYARDDMTSPSVDVKSRERCRNDSRMCAEWAMRGMCEPRAHGDDWVEDGDLGGGVVFMMNRCPLACQMCEHLMTFHKCAGQRHPTGPVFGSRKEVRNFFEQKRLRGRGGTGGGDGEDDDGSWEEYGPVFASHPNSKKEDGEMDYVDDSDPYVVVFEKFLSDEEADRLTSLGAEIGWTMLPSTAGGASALASCRNAGGKCEEDDVHRRIAHRIASLVGKNSTTMSHLEPMEMIHYSSSNGNYVDDDASPEETTLQSGHDISDLWKPAGPRVLSLFVFLSDGGEGGGLGFPHLDWLHVPARKGAAVLWTDPDRPSMSFEMFPPRADIDKIMFSALVHLRERDWADANVRGCDRS